MGRLVLQMGVSIDGFVAAADGSHPWGEGREDPAQKRWKLDSVSRAGAHLIAPLFLELAEAHTYPTGTAIHVYRPRRTA